MLQGNSPKASVPPAPFAPLVIPLSAAWERANLPTKISQIFIAPWNHTRGREKTQMARDYLEKYGPYVRPSVARAERHYLHNCDHHVMFSLLRTRTSDLSEFGNGLMLYFWFLRCMGMVFTLLTVVFCLPLAIVYARSGNFFMSGIMRKLTLGNYGPVYEEGVALAGGVVRCSITLVQHPNLMISPNNCRFRGSTPLLLVPRTFRFIVLCQHTQNYMCDNGAL